MTNIRALRLRAGELPIPIATAALAGATPSSWSIAAMALSPICSAYASPDMLCFCIVMPATVSGIQAATSETAPGLDEAPTPPEACPSEATADEATEGSPERLEAAGPQAARAVTSVAKAAPFRNRFTRSPCSCLQGTWAKNCSARVASVAISQNRTSPFA